MKNNELEKKISSAYEKITPDILDAVLSDCKEQKGNYLIMTNTGLFSQAWARRFTAAAASVALLTGGAFLFAAYRNLSTVASTISLDVNPSVEISINKNEKVLVDFYADWCGPCKMISPIIEEIANEHPEISVCKVNVDITPEYARKYNIDDYLYE